MPVTAPSVLFDKADAAPATLAAIGRAGVSGLSASSFSPDEAWGFLLAAEKDASRQLRVFFSPTEVFAGDPTDAEKAAVQDGTPWVEEAAYDYDPEFFQGESWGFISTRQKPIIAVHSISFQYPSPTQQVFRIPDAWIRLDRKYGHIRLVPAAQSFSAPLTAFVMQALGGGRTVPFMLNIRYSAGLSDAASQYPDLLDLIKKMAVLRAINSIFPAQSGSISADGLSESASVDLEKFQGGIDAMLDRLRDAIHGVRMIVM